MEITNIPGRASDAGPSLSEDVDTRGWLELALNARDAVDRATAVDAPRAATAAEIRDAIDLLNLALERL